MKTEKRLKEIISEAVQDVMPERTISQNKRDNKELQRRRQLHKRALTGGKQICKI